MDLDAQIEFNPYKNPYNDSQSLLNAQVPKKYEYNDANVKKARNLIGLMNADFGGTEIYGAMSSAFKCQM